MLGVGSGPNASADGGGPDGLPGLARGEGALSGADRTALAVLASVQGLGPVTSGALIALQRLGQ